MGLTLNVKNCFGERTYGKMMKKKEFTYLGTTLCLSKSNLCIPIHSLPLEISPVLKLINLFCGKHSSPLHFYPCVFPDITKWKKKS